MKRFARVAILLSTTVAFLPACTPPASPLSSPTTPAPAATLETPATTQRVAPQTVDTSIRLSDANGKFLGYVTSSNDSGLEIYTQKGFLVSMDWSGNLLDGIALFTKSGGGGTVFFQWAKEQPNWGYVTVINGQPYIAVSHDANGFAIADSSITSCQSCYFNGTIFDIPATPVLEDYAAYPLKKVQLGDIGVPSSIPLPMRSAAQ